MMGRIGTEQYFCWRGGVGGEGVRTGRSFMWKGRGVLDEIRMFFLVGSFFRWGVGGQKCTISHNVVRETPSLEVNKKNAKTNF